MDMEKTLLNCLMIRSGIRPDEIVYMAVLSACSPAGLVDEGLRYFKSMVGDYNITPNQEIYGCVVDLLGHAGRVEEAYESVWGALLGACKAHKLPNLGKLVARRILDLRPNMVGTYVMLSNIYIYIYMQLKVSGEWGVRKRQGGVGLR